MRIFIGLFLEVFSLKQLMYIFLFQAIPIKTMSYPDEHKWTNDKSNINNTYF